MGSPVGVSSLPNVSAYSDVQTIAFFDAGGGDELFVGGYFHFAGDTPAYFVARWDGAAWHALAQGQGIFNGVVYAFEAFDDGEGERVYAAGRFVRAGEVSTNTIARWTGTAWEAVPGNPFDTLTSAFALVSFDDGTGEALYVGTNGQAGSGISRFDGTTWSDVGGGVGGAVYVLETWDDGGGPALYAGGYFPTAGAATVNQVARWDGLAWSPLGAGVSSAFTPSVEALAVHDDGSGEALYVGGRFDTAGAAPASYIARWDGASWSNVGSGFNDRVYALISADVGFGGPSLFAGGRFTLSGNATRLATARWDGVRWAKLTTRAGRSRPSPCGTTVRESGSTPRVPDGSATHLRTTSSAWTRPTGRCSGTRGGRCSR